nr:SMI1/KNR4 family protein [Flavobacterium crocinum]
MSYKEFYTANNGGSIKENNFFKNDDDKFETFSINDFYHLVANEENDKFETNVFTIIDKNLLENILFVPWGFDGSNNQLYLDFTYEEPKVYAYYYDEDDTGIPKQVFLADSIEAFLKKLRVYEEEEDDE